MFYSVDALEDGIVRLVDDAGNIRMEKTDVLPKGIQQGDILKRDHEHYSPAPEEAARRRAYAAELLGRVLNGGR